MLTGSVASAHRVSYKAVDPMHCGTLYPGSRGGCVKTLQYALNDRNCMPLDGGYRIPVDGCYGPLTFGVVREFKDKHNLGGPRGKVTRKMWNKLIRRGCA